MAQQYQVLARKYRPRNFHELVGQNHVSQALINAIDYNRLHHAYLFTGTRGVGKTTIARILAKCLNCETGITSTPCGICNHCVAIDEGRFIDLIEIDAASRTKVEDTRELIDNVPYAPTQGRYKVYLIDEVHMLSTHSFNALLKTLEEPPSHVKFLLATTDPQKLPITIISRCLQFVLRPLPQQAISKHLAYILTNENVHYSDAALWQLANAAKGSVRDALSLTDQAIAFGQGQLSDATVIDMLGLIDSADLVQLVSDIYAGNNQAVAAHIEQMRAQLVDAGSMFDGLAELLHQLAMTQLLPDIALNVSDEQATQIQHLASTMSADVLQLYYEIIIQGRENIKLANTPLQALEMSLLRLLAFRPLGTNEVNVSPEHNLNNQINEQSDNYITNRAATETKQFEEQVEPPVTSSSNNTYDDDKGQLREAVEKHDSADDKSSVDSDDKKYPINLQLSGSKAELIESDVGSKNNDTFESSTSIKDIEHAEVSDIYVDTSEPVSTVPNEQNLKSDFTEKQIDRENSYSNKNSSTLKDFDGSEKSDNRELQSAKYNDNTSSNSNNKYSTNADIVNQYSNNDIENLETDEPNSYETGYLDNDDSIALTNSLGAESAKVNDDRSNTTTATTNNFELNGQGTTELENSERSSLSTDKTSIDSDDNIISAIDNFEDADDPRLLMQCKPVTLAGAWTPEKWDYWLQTARQSGKLGQDELALARQGVMTGDIYGQSEFKVAFDTKNVQSIFNQLAAHLTQQFDAQVNIIIDESLIDKNAELTPQVRQKKRLELAHEKAKKGLMQSPIMQSLSQFADASITHIKLLE